MSAPRTSRTATHQPWPGLIAAYRDRLPVDADTPVVTLFEGATPLVPARELSKRTGCEVYLKVEGANPTGSFKDRGMTMAISKAAQDGAQAVICASTGNTSASAAAYAVRAGMVCAVSGNLVTNDVVYEGVNERLVTGWEAAIGTALRAVVALA